ncbi:MAG: class I SAM-dependent methyltransferase [Saprospiraceae bacterium]|nr:class I SAM-dependent methyltransferase [Saprospiraceae bacterium]
MKDLFSKQAITYAQFRPNYPSELFDFVLQNTGNKQVAWDCATGNGQAAKVLAPHFEKVYATDMSQKQLDNAVKADNIFYSVGKAEKTDFTEGVFDLITVAQAIHWFDFEQFYTEVQRVAKPNATLAIWGYGTLCFQDEQVDELVQNFYWNIVGTYWDAERRHIDALYETIPFPFESIETPKFSMNFNWNRNELEGYLNSWSSVQNFIKANDYNPIPNLMLDLQDIWDEFEQKALSFPIFMKIGKVVRIN